jgi:hypothetical protein
VSLSKFGYISFSSFLFQEVTIIVRLFTVIVSHKVVSTLNLLFT